MTTEEAISQLEEINREEHVYSDAVEMAIEALEKQIPLLIRLTQKRAEVLKNV